MKRWTLMLVPHGQGDTRSMDVGVQHLWLSMGLVTLLLLAAISLTFTTTFLLQRWHKSEEENRELSRINRDLTQQQSARTGQVPAALSDSEREEIERRIRDEYKDGQKAINEYLSELYDLEDHFREVNGLSPRVSPVVGYVTIPSESNGGKGGPPGPASDSVLDEDEAWQTPHVIYGLANPSVDLILQEIELRSESLGRVYRGLGSRPRPPGPRTYPLAYREPETPQDHLPLRVAQGPLHQRMAPA